MSESTKTYVATYRIDLQNAYGVCYKTMRKWLRSVPNLKSKHVQLFKPYEVKLIMEHLGEPNQETKKV